MSRKKGQGNIKSRNDAGGHNNVVPSKGADEDDLEGAGELFYRSVKFAIQVYPEDGATNRHFVELNSTGVSTATIANIVKKDTHAIELALNYVHAISHTTGEVRGANNSNKKEPRLIFLKRVRDDLLRHAKKHEFPINLG